LARTPVIISWSGGKDSALLLQHLRDQPQYDVVGLVTTVTDHYDRISIHGVRREILHAQVAQIGLPLLEATIPPTASNASYETAFLAALGQLRAAHPGLRTIAFGDLFLDDVRVYRQQLLAGHDWQPLFPLWGLDTGDLARRFIRDGFRAIVCCADTTQLGPEWAGREFDDGFLATLPPTVDPCGERGEFHTCVYGGPIFAQPLALRRGDRVRREERFEYCDLRLEAPEPGQG
jgi:uncharacterized protein (TIGR00290 family)